ncbi:MAG: AzlD domain-containing protein [Desulfobacterales bacterium]|jgi:branched-subunit amino acid transport protein
MMDTSFLTLVFGMGLVTFIPRWLPLAFLTGRRLPTWFVEWLDLIPAAILSALLAPALVTGGTPRYLDLFRSELWVAVPTMLVALKTKSLGATVLAGMLLFWIVAMLTG